MKFKFLGKVAVVAAIFLSVSVAVAGGSDIAAAHPVDPTQDAIHAYVSASVFFGDNPKIAGGFDNDTSVSLTANIDQRKSNITFIPELGLWFPLWSNHQNMIVNFLAFANWVPGSNTVDSSGIDPSTGDTAVVKVHHTMFNIGVGLNFLHYFAQRWFGLVMVGGGANYTDLHADLDSNDVPTDLDFTTGTSSVYRPFWTVKLGIGANVSEKSQLMIFGRYTGVSTRTITVSDNLQSPQVQSVFVGLPSCWWEVGVQFTRAFSL